MSTSSTTPRQTRPLSNSPLFWLILYGGMGLIVLVGIGPKHARRQARLERMNEARQRMAREQATGREIATTEVGPFETGTPSRLTEPQKRHEAEALPLGYLIAVLACIMIASAVAIVLIGRRRVQAAPDALPTTSDAERTP